MTEKREMNPLRTRTLRDEMAMAALTALVRENAVDSAIMGAAEAAYRYADAMLQARDRRPR